MDTKLSAEETAVYDRQIRTWGLQAQHRIRGANVLLVNIEGLGAEIAKNLVLAGIGSLTVVDDKAISLRDLSTHFLLSKSDVGQNRAAAAVKRLRALNPRVKIAADASAISSKQASFFQHFDVVCLCLAHHESLDVVRQVNDACREGQQTVMFFACELFGSCGYAFSDLQEHKFEVEQGKDKGTESQHLQYCSFSQIIQLSLMEQWTCLVSGGSNRRMAKHLASLFIAIQLCKQVIAEEVKGDDEMIGAIRRLRTHLIEKGDIAADRVSEETLEALCKGRETYPVASAAVLGGLVAKEIIISISQNDQPQLNLQLFDGVTGDVRTAHVAPTKLNKA